MQETQTRHGRRADGIVVVSVPMSRALRAELKKLAAKDGQKTAPWVREKLQSLVRRSNAARASV